MAVESTPSIQVPLPDYIREAATVAAWAVIDEHIQKCPIAKIEKRVEVLEARFNILIGAVIASGAVGGGVGVGIAKLLGG